MNKAQVWYRADCNKLLGHKDTTIYMTSKAYNSMTVEFMLSCVHRNITIEVIDT